MKLLQLNLSISRWTTKLMLIVVGILYRGVLFPFLSFDLFLPRSIERDWFYTIVCYRSTLSFLQG